MWRILYITRKEFIQVFADIRMFGIIFIAPIIQLFLFGYAVTTDIKNIDLAIMDQDHSADSRELKDAIFNSGYFRSAGSVLSDAEIADALVRGRASVVLVIPDEFAADLARGETTTIQVLLDGAESNAMNVALGYLGGILSSFGTIKMETRAAALAARLGRNMSSLPVVTAETRYRFNPELKSAWYMVPGVLGMIMMVITMLLTSLAITREREVGTMEQLVVTPIKPWQLLAGKMLPFAIVGLVDITLILAAGVGHFGLPFVGSIALLYFAAVVFLFSTLGVGLLISTLSNTQQQAMFVSFLFLMPSILLSGFMFPIANMPLPVQYLTYANPLRYFLLIVRSIILKGNGWAELAPDFAYMFVLGVVLFALASLRFRKTVG